MPLDITFRKNSHKKNHNKPKVIIKSKPLIKPARVIKPKHRSSRLPRTQPAIEASSQPSSSRQRTLTKPSTPVFHKKGVRIKSFTILAFLSLPLSYYMITALITRDKNSDLQTRINELEQSAATITTGNEVEEIVTAVNKLIALPADETPVLATVANVERIRQAPFFAEAQDGDKLLMYDSTRRAFLYRPSTNQLINTADINLPDMEMATSQPTP